jgi:hypothetical protein
MSVCVAVLVGLIVNAVGIAQASANEAEMADDQPLFAAHLGGEALARCRFDDQFEVP